MSNFEFRKKILNELANLPGQVDDTSSAAVRLTNTQKNVLLSIYTAPTPEAAYDVTTGSENVVVARKQLRSIGLINVDDGNARAGVTDSGQEALINANLIDETGQVTEDGEVVLSQEEVIKQDFENATESYKILKTLI